MNLFGIYCRWGQRLMIFFIVWYHPYQLLVVICCGCLQFPLWISVRNSYILGIVILLFLLSPGTRAPILGTWWALNLLLMICKSSLLAIIPWWVTYTLIAVCQEKHSCCQTFCSQMMLVFYDSYTTSYIILFSFSPSVTFSPPPTSFYKLKRCISILKNRKKLLLILEQLIC